jgi:predicted permease
MSIAAEQVAILYIIVAVGVLADKTNLFPEKTARLCTNLLFFIITPAVIVHSFLQIEYDAETAKSLFIAIGCGLLLHLVASVINIPFFRKGDRDKGSVLKFACVYGNCGYMALPLAYAVLGPEGVFYCSAVIMAFQMFVFTHGVYIMSATDKSAEDKKEKIHLSNQTCLSSLSTLKKDFFS